MITNNPFSTLAEIVPAIAMQGFVIAMAALTLIGVLVDIIHKKNVKYFFENAKKTKEYATKNLPAGKAAAIVAKTVASDVMTSSEFCGVKRRVAHLLGMYGSIFLWVTTFILIFSYSAIGSTAPALVTQLWHLGALMTCVGGYWFWFTMRVDVAAEAHKWYRIVFADLFVLALVTSSTFALAWSFTQFSAMAGWSVLFFILYVVSNIILFGGVYWSKFAHMFYKPGAAIQKNLAEADGSRDNLPPPADAPEQFGLGIKREEPKHY